MSYRPLSHFTAINTPWPLSTNPLCNSPWITEVGDDKGRKTQITRALDALFEAEGALDQDLLVFTIGVGNEESRYVFSVPISGQRAKECITSQDS